MGIATGAAIVGGGLLAGGLAGGIISGNAAAKAAQSAAGAQQAAAAQALAFQKATQERAMQLAQARPDELASIQSILQLQQRSISQGEKYLEGEKALLDAVDPALKEAGKQALELLQGKEASSLSVIRNQRQLQRQRLQETLKNRLGTGYETSTAGAQALNAFDQQTDETLQGAQQTTMGSLLGLSAQVRPDLIGKSNSVYSTGANIGSIGLAAQQNIAARGVNAITGNRVDFSDFINTAGSPFVGQYQRAQNMGSIFSGLAGIGGGIIGAGIKPPTSPGGQV